MANTLGALIRNGRSRTRAATTFVIVAMALGVCGMFAHMAMAAGEPTAIKVDTGDANLDGHIDSIFVTFNVPMDATITAPNGWSVDGFTNANTPSQWIGAQGGAATRLQLLLIPHTGAGDTDLKPDVHYVAGASAKTQSAGLKTEMLTANFNQTTTVKVTDATGPVLMSVLANDYEPSNVFYKDSLDEMDLIFSEPVRVAGQTPVDQMIALEQAMKFSVLPGGVCIGDGNGVQTTNFPVPSSGSAKSPIIEPTGTNRSRTIRVQVQTDSNASSIKTPAIPNQCGVGVDGNGTANITDAASNAAISQDAPATNSGRRNLQIAPVQLFYEDGAAQTKPGIGTQDLLPVNGNGYVDAIKVTFDHVLDDSTVTDALAGKFTVVNGNEAAQITSVDTGTPNDGSLLVHIAGVQWGGGVRPAISYSSAGCLLHAKVPTPGQFACVDTFSGKQAQDKVPPAIIGAATLDTDGNGVVDHVTVAFTENLQPTGATADGWTVNGTPASGIVVTANSSVATLAIPESAAIGSGDTATVAFNAGTGNTQDTAGNKVVSQSLTAADGAAPVLKNATSFDTDHDGAVDTITYEFTEPVDEATTTYDVFSVGPTAATSFGASSLDAGTNPTDKFVTVKVGTGIPGTGHIGASYGGLTLTDLHGNLAPTADKSPDQVIDGSGPVATLFRTTPATPFATGDVRIDATYSEPLNTGFAPAAAIGAKAAVPLTDATHDANGFDTTDPTKWAGIVTLESGDCDQQNGCSQSVTIAGGKDLDGNTALAPTPLPVFVDTLAPDAATAVASSPVQDSGTFSSNKLNSHTRNVSVGASIVAGQVMSGTTGGTAELLLDGTPLSPAVTAAVGGSASSVTLATSFADAAALRSAIAEGQHTVAVKLCDGALNCSQSDPTTIVADYTPVDVTLGGPNNGSYNGGDHLCITWTADATATDLDDVSLYYTTGGTTLTEIAHNVGVAPTGTCEGGAAGYDWTLPTLNTTTLKVIAKTLDGFGNDKSAASSGNIAVQTVTETATSIAASSTLFVYGTTAKITGAVTGGGSGVAGKTVTLLGRTNGTSSFVTLATTTTNSDGEYSFNARPMFNTDYQVTFAKTGPFLASQSGIQSVRVFVGVALGQSATELQRGQAVGFSGYVLPAKPGKRVTLQILTSKGWYYLGTLTLSSKSTYNFVYRMNVPGSRIFRVVYYSQDGLNVGNTSLYKRVTWK